MFCQGKSVLKGQRQKEKESILHLLFPFVKKVTPKYAALAILLEALPSFFFNFNVQ